MKMKKPTPAGAAFVGVILMLSLALVPAALAGKPGAGGGGTGGGSSSRLALVLSTDVNGNGVANWNDTVTYDVSTSATSSPQVKTACYQSGTLVLHSDAAFYAGNPFAYMDWLQLTSGMWTGGAADCTATMYYTAHKGAVTLATLSFHVDA